MSFDIFFQRFHNGNSVTFPRTLIEIAFGSNIFTRDPESNYISLMYPDGSGGDIYVSNNDHIVSFSINRPGKNPAFWSSIYKIMHKAGLILYWPGDASVIVTDAMLYEHMPPDMLKALGSPTLVRSGSEILEAIQRL